MLYIFFMYFGVLNVVVGAFVHTTQDAANKDREAIVTKELQEVQMYMDKVKEFFLEADVDQSGTLSWSEFKEHMKNNKVKAYFQALDLDVSQAHVLFDLLDPNSNDQVTIEEFIKGCVRLKGHARSIDLNMLLLQSRKLAEQVQ